MARADLIEPAPARAPLPLSAVFAAVGRFVLPLVVIVGVLVAWELFARSGLVTPFMLPRLSAVLERIWTDALSGELVINMGLTLYRALVGFLIAAVGGILLGMAMSRSVGVNWLFDPIISVGFPMPKIAFLPVVILWLGVYDVSKITIIVIDAIFPVIAATVIAI
jgi:ABC-type nitrate/sulfonate/bicarbonate transport system permease component